VVAAPVSPDRAAEVFRSSQGLVSGHRPCGDGFPWLGVFAGRDDGVGATIGATIGDRIVARSSVIGAVGGDAADLLMGRDLAQQVRQHRRIADVAPGDLDRPNLQRFLVDPEVDLAPNAPFRTAMLACIPLAFTFDLDPGAVDQQVQRPLGASIWDVHGQCLLAAGQCAEVGHRPVEPCQQ